tara:strand:- start:126 stop:1040 length:915 start_codon:yes stop_codon:yes gene_type:complete
MQEENNPVIEEIEKEIEDTKRKASGDDFEIEIAEEQPKEEEKKELEAKSEETDEYGSKVQNRIKKLVEQRRNAELETKRQQEANDQLSKRLERLEKGTQSQAQNQASKEFQQRYSLTKQALTKAVEEGDTEAQVNFSEQLADMRASIRVNELQKQMQQSQSYSPTVGRAQQVATNPTPQKAMGWWESNRWFNGKGYERETAAARAIDVQLDLEGFDKNSDEYYNNLNSRLQKVFPELISDSEVAESKPRARSSKVVTPSTGGSSYKGNRVRMTQDQLRMARELGINDEASLKKYASEIQKSQGR